MEDKLRLGNNTMTKSTELGLEPQVSGPLKALLLGCGRIGGMLDLHTNEIQTYAKTLKRFGISTTFYDIDPEKMTRLAKKYDGEYLTELHVEKLVDFHIAIVATPTNIHAHYLKMLMSVNIPVIICEKPVCISSAKLAEVKLAYRESASKVLVNYTRRFTPLYKRMKDLINLYFEEGIPMTIIVEYQRGFSNNCSHALDLINSLFPDLIFSQSDHSVCSATFDEFESDPTITSFSKTRETSLLCIGHANAKFSHFEVKIMFERGYVILQKCASEIGIYCTDTNHGTIGRDSYYSQTKLRCQERVEISSLTSGVISHAVGILHGTLESDNFEEAVELNRLVLEVLSYV